MIHVSIPTDLEPFVRDVVASGAYHDPAEVVGEALRLLARREQLLHDVKAGIGELDRGEYTEYGEESRRQFLADIKAEEETRFPYAEGVEIARVVSGYRDLETLFGAS
jgi:putative addiction module CopG family antidote